MEKRGVNTGANEELAYRGAYSFFPLELTHIEKGSKDNKTCHRDRIARLTAPCPSHKKNFNVTLFANADTNANANANANAGGSTIALPGLRPGELKRAQLLPKEVNILTLNNSLS